MKVFTGNANRELAERIADYVKAPLGAAEVDRFPDGEVSVKIGENVRGKDVFIVQPTCNPVNEHLMELLIMVDALRRASASRITAVIPFYGYARQDRKDQPRAPITAKLVANLLVASGTNRLLTLDLHAQQIMGFFDIPVDHLYASPVLSKYLVEKKLKNPVVVSPDIGGLRMAYAYSQTLQSGLAVIAKQRKGPSEVEVLTVVPMARDEALASLAQNERPEEEQKQLRRLILSTSTDSLSSATARVQQEQAVPNEALAQLDQDWRRRQEVVARAMFGPQPGRPLIV